MMRYLGIGCLLVLSLTACTSYNFEAPATPYGQLCVEQCQQAYKLCQANCEQPTDNCEARARALARLEFDRYQSHRMNRGLPVTRHVDDFYRPYECATSSTACDEDYRRCFQRCGGRLNKYEECFIFCDFNK